MMFAISMVTPIIIHDPTAPESDTSNILLLKVATVDAVNNPHIAAPNMSMTVPVAIPVAVPIAAGAPPTGNR